MWAPRTSLRSTAALLALALLPGLAAARAKTDIVVLTNGDRMTGEIKQLSRGILQLSTDAVGTVNIEWDDVDSLQSAYQFRVEIAKGGRYFGSLLLMRGGVLRVIQGEQAQPVQQLNVVAITPLEASFWQQIDGSISLGLSYTKSNSLGQLTADFDARYRTPLRLLRVEFSSIATAQEERATQRRQDLSFSYAHLFEGPLFALAGVAAQSNDELGLELRLLLTSGVGAKLIQSTRSELVSGLGLSVNREWTHDSDDASNLEAFVSAQYSVFRYDYPKTSISLEGTVFPNLTSWGRVRSELDVSASRELVKDFTLFLSFYDSFDSDPADPTAARNDYGLVTSVGWTF